MDVEVRLAEAINEIDEADWRRLAGANPFLDYGFLVALESSGCASPQTGWHPRHVVLEQGGRVIGVAPAYLKTHSRGEFVFDQGWARAYEQHGLEYYPKLLLAVPFTPVTGPRLLAATPEHKRLLAHAIKIVSGRLGVSSSHVLFPSEMDEAALAGEGFLVRQQVQFHWVNQSYADFAGFLGAMNHEKRKKVKQDRRRVQEAGVTFRWLRGVELTAEDLTFFYSCYTKTYQEHWSSPYLTEAFFHQFNEACPGRLLLVMAYRGGKRLATALNVVGEGALYGRYWGTQEYVSGLHFEACYCQAIDYCISQGISTFEGGAQGEHKMARGLSPTRTTSAHWIANRAFSESIEDFLRRETVALEDYTEELQSSSPFRRT